MSTGLSTDAAAPQAELAAGFVRRPRGLALALVEDIGRRIGAHLVRPGEKLPTETAIMQTYGVSRTVVREALSRLQAAGLVETRHGVGTFVLDAPTPGLLRLDPADVPASIDALEVLELRVSLETEAASLAAVRRTEANLQVMREALEQFGVAMAGQGDTVTPDFRFHYEIALATGNRYFADILRHMGTAIIPRTRITATRVAPEDQADYLQKVNREHAEIYEAIARQDPDAARAAMRLHLTNSRERLRHAQEAARSST
ncbi:FadR/GntR family transcriptional regulator [Xylophilus sp. GW821-FHT01B05]